MFRLINPKNYLRKARDLYYLKSYDIERVKKEERKKFEQRGFDYTKALAKLNNVLSALKMGEFSSKNSVHTLLFSCISQVSKVRDILEIGTYKGEAALILSKLFPNSLVTTLDLPDSDPILHTSYMRESPYVMKEYKEEQKKNLADPRITFVEKNSFFLPGEMTKKFDLIWIDGGHLYPEVAWDICNAYHLCKLGGWIMCDDVIIDKNGQRNEYVSPDSYEVLEYIRARTGEEVTYFLKKEHPMRSADPRKRKYVALMKKQ